MSMFDDRLAEAASLLERGDLDGAQRLLKVSPSPRSEPENHRLGALRTNLGLAQVNAGSIAAARENLTKALTHLRLAQAEDPSAVALAYGNLGLLEREVGDLEAAQRHYEHSLAVFEELGDRANRGWALLNLGFVKKDQNMLTLARIDLKKALSLLTRQEDLRNRGHAALGLGMVFERLNQPNEAIAHYHMALEAYRGAKDEDSEAVTLQNLGVLYSELGQFEEALDYYRRAEQIYEDCGDAVGRAEILSARASV